MKAESDKCVINNTEHEKSVAIGKFTSHFSQSLEDLLKIQYRDVFWGTTVASSLERVLWLICGSFSLYKINENQIKAKSAVLDHIIIRTSDSLLFATKKSDRIFMIQNNNKGEDDDDVIDINWTALSNLITFHFVIYTTMPDFVPEFVM